MHSGNGRAVRNRGPRATGFPVPDAVWALSDSSALAQERETIGDGYQADGDALIVMQLHVQRTNRHRIRVLV